MERQEADAQQVLDELLRQGLLPFALRVGELIYKQPSRYKVRFHDSRIRSVKFSWAEGESFTEIFRAATLNRVAKMSGPLQRTLSMQKQQIEEESIYQLATT